MKSNPFSDDKIEQYLLGNLSDKERLEMEQNLREQPELAAELELRRLEFDTAEELIATDIRAQFQRLQEEEENGSRMQVWRKRWYWFAAVVALLVSFFLLYWQWAPPPPPPPPPPPDPTEILPKVTLPNSDTTREKQPKHQDDDPKRRALAANFYRNFERGSLGNLRGNGAQNPLNHAIEALERSAYEDALKALEKIGKGDLQYGRAQMLRAHAHFRLNDFSKAAACADYVAAFEKTPLLENGQWLYILSMIGAGEMKSNKFRVASDTILKDMGHQFHEEMVALRDSILQLN
ncbi:MAG: hypothetical protein ACKVT2_23075 [Saprospiraceae bacterium]